MITNISTELVLQSKKGISNKGFCENMWRKREAHQTVPISSYNSTLLPILHVPGESFTWGGMGWERRKTSPLLGLQHLKLSQIQRCTVDSDAGFGEVRQCDESRKQCSRRVSGALSKKPA